MKTLRLLLLGALLLSVVAAAATAAGSVLVPDTFLRPWDPVTVFFTRDVGLAAGTAEEAPERLVTLTPPHPGAFTWLDERTLQFRPAEPWPTLTRFTWTVEGRKRVVSTLMAAPVRTIPGHAEEGLDPVEEISLSFSEPLDPLALARMVTLELRPLPGVGSEGARWLDANDFEVKPSEAATEGDGRTYVLALEEAIPHGTRVVVHFRLSLDDATPESFSQVSFSTAEPFRVLSVGCAEQRWPVTPAGTRQPREQAISCASPEPSVVVELSAPLGEVTAIAGRNLVRFTPAVLNLRFEVEGRLLRVFGDFAYDTRYRVTLVPTPIKDRKGRRLEMTGESEGWLHFPQRPSYLAWSRSSGLLERNGPQMVPLQGRGDERLDLRIHAVDALDRSFWPFPEGPVVLDESLRPPGPGEEPQPWTGPEPIPARELARHVASLGSPLVSAIVDLPLRRDGAAASFGLDLSKHLPAAAGTYLVGLRRLDGSTRRAWMRVQVTDLSLSAVDEPRAVRFAVTSLSTGKAVPGARLRVEGSRWKEDRWHWETLFAGTTDAHGLMRFDAPGARPADVSPRVLRVVAQAGDDVLVIDPTRPAESYADNLWSSSHETWLQWAFEDVKWRGPQVATLCHVFTERPVYRPGETVHAKGYARRRAAGALSRVRGDAFVVVSGPGDVEYRYPVTLTDEGSFYHAFSEEDLPTGDFTARLVLPEPEGGEQWCGEVTFKMEAYRLPQFEVRLHAPDRVPLDEEFEVSLSSLYYAGGKVAGRPVAWRVTQFPHTFTPKAREGFRYSSDGRYSGVARFESTPRLEKADTTDGEGTARIVLDPTIEPTAQPRRYVVEATVTGADDQTVTATRRIIASPSFVLGLKAPRFLERAQAVDAQVIVVGPDDGLISGVDVAVRLLRRQWHSHLRASDFSDGVARYVTDVVDEAVLEKTVVSTAEPLTVALPLGEAGVYIVEIETHDRLDRAQTVSVDLYAGGDAPVGWPKPASGVFTVATDAKEYDPGATAALVLKSPFQTATALAVIEAPEGNEYRWLPVRGGSAVLSLPVKETWTPRVPVHFVLMRGRAAGPAPAPGATTDLGRPTTLAATAWVAVSPVAYRIDVGLTHAATARPGQTVPVTMDLKDPSGRPLPGEVTLWLVDQAVLALGREQRLDPLPDFITPATSHVTVRDTRNLVLGAFSLAQAMGGDGAAREESSILDRTTVRRNFQPVPFYDPRVMVDSSGTATVLVKLPDDLTNFMVRAKAASLEQRFGHATGAIAVRLPVIVEPALPRFVRPGDRFVASGVGRVVEGEGGPATAQGRFDGLSLDGSPTRQLVMTPNAPERIDFPVVVETPAFDARGRILRRDVSVTVGIERKSDGASDAFEVKLPVREDRRRVTQRVIADLEAGMATAFPPVAETPRAGTVRREALVSTEAGIVRMAAGLDFLLEYPYGCTEQRVSRTRAQVALKQLRGLLREDEGEEPLERSVAATQEWLASVVDDDGLAAYWPGGRGTVSLTAWVVGFMADVREAGLPVDDALLATLTRALESALRSDYRHFIDGEAYAERAWALSALARVGKFNEAYASELARKAQQLDLESEAQVLLAFASTGDLKSATVSRLAKDLSDGLVTRLHQGREVYGGLQERRERRSGLILPTETRTLAEMTRALHRARPEEPRIAMATDALVTLGRGDGWGTTNANASALLSLAEILGPGSRSGPPTDLSVDATFGKDVRRVVLDGSTPTAHVVSTDAGAAALVLRDSPGAVTVVARLETSYVPEADGSTVAAQAAGFVVTRELLRVRGEDEPADRVLLAEPSMTFATAVGQVVEEHLQVVNPQERHYVAVVVPLAAGMEPLNPRLATAPPEARPKGALTLEPTYAAFMDDHAAFYYDTLPAGTYDFYFRTRATVPGTFIQPAAWAELMYDAAVTGSSAGARVEVSRARE